MNKYKTAEDFSLAELVLYNLNCANRIAAGASPSVTRHDDRPSDDVIKLDYTEAGVPLAFELKLTHYRSYRPATFTSPAEDEEIEYDIIVKLCGQQVHADNSFELYAGLMKEFGDIFDDAIREHVRKIKEEQ